MFENKCTIGRSLHVGFALTVALTPLVSTANLLCEAEVEKTYLWTSTPSGLEGAVGVKVTGISWTGTAQWILCNTNAGRVPNDQAFNGTTLGAVTMHGTTCQTLYSTLLTAAARRESRIFVFDDTDPNVTTCDAIPELAGPGYAGDKLKLVR